MNIPGSNTQRPGSESSIGHPLDVIIYITQHIHKLYSMLNPWTLGSLCITSDHHIYTTCTSTKVPLSHTSLYMISIHLMYTTSTNLYPIPTVHPQSHTCSILTPLPFTLLPRFSWLMIVWVHTSSPWGSVIEPHQYTSAGLCGPGRHGYEMHHSWLQVQDQYQRSWGRGRMSSSKIIHIICFLKHNTV